MIKKCKTCKYYSSFVGVCCNPGSDERADFTDSEYSCKHWTIDRVKQIAYHYGKEKQTIKAMEELAELTQALSKALLGEESNIAEEIADVEIMLEQLKLLWETRSIQTIKEEKLDRQLERIEND